MTFMLKERKSAVLVGYVRNACGISQFLHASTPAGRLPYSVGITDCIRNGIARCPQNIWYD